MLESMWSWIRPQPFTALCLRPRTASGKPRTFGGKRKAGSIVYASDNGHRNHSDAFVWCIRTHVAVIAMHMHARSDHRMSRSSQCTCTRAATIAMHTHAGNYVGVRLW